MNTSIQIIKEDAKHDWLKVVKHHKKRQKGLPALSTLNTNAGNVEHNINMFNHMQPSSHVTVNAINGSTSTDSGMCESFDNLSEIKQQINDGWIVLEYDDISVEVDDEPYSTTYYFDNAFGNYLPRDHRTSNKKIQWTYEANIDLVCEFLLSIPEVDTYVEEHTTTQDPDGEQAFEEMLPFWIKKYNEQLLDHFYEKAEQDAHENYMNESVVKKSENCLLDDNFDMSMRTLL